MTATIMRAKSAKTHAAKIINNELSSSAVWITCALGMTVLILPRIFPLSVNYVYYDDFIARPLELLKIHRVVGAAEEAFWFSVFGPDYLRSYIPKIVSFVYIMVGVWTLVQIFRAWGISFVTAFLAVLLFLINPIFTELLVWNTISADNLALTLVLLGYRAQLETSRYALGIGITLGFLALATYQITVGLPAMLVLIEATLLLIRNGDNSIPWNWKRRLVWVALPIALYAVYLIVAKYILGYSSFGNEASRGLATPSEMLSFRFLLQKYQEASHGYLNVFQPLLGYYFGTEAAWRGAWRVWAFIVLSIPTSLLLVRASPRKIISCSALFIAALLAPSAFDWVVNVSTSGWRTAIGMSLAFSLWFVVLCTILATGKLRRIVVLVDLAALALAISLVPVTVADAKNRALGTVATNRLVAFLKADPGLAPPQAAAIRIDTEPQARQKRSGAIVVTFQETACQDYSVTAYQVALGPMLHSGGVNLISPPRAIAKFWPLGWPVAANSAKALPEDVTRRLTTLCAQNRAQQKCGVLGVRDAISNIGAACFYQPRPKNDTQVGADD